MRRFLWIRLILLILATPGLLIVPPAATAQDETEDWQSYRSEQLGISFEYPRGWQVNEQIPTRTVTASSSSDLAAVRAGKAPDGLLFSITISTFREIGAERLEDFAPILQKIAGTPDLDPDSVRIGGADGIQIDRLDIQQDVATRTAILSIGKRRVAVLRGVSTVSGWTKGNKTRFGELVDTLNFFPPKGLVDGESFGKVLWQLPADKLTDIADLAVGGNGAVLYVTDRNLGIWQLGANGTSGEVTKPTGIGQFGALGVLQSGLQFIADGVGNAIWAVMPQNGNVTRLIGGRVGTGNGMFGPHSPLSFAFGLRGAIYVLDENEKGLRIQVFNRGGEWTATWELADVLPTSIDHPVISTDDSGNAYLIGRNSPGIIKIAPDGKVVSTDLGKAVLANTGPLALVVDRFDNFFVATADQGILNLNQDGKLLGVIGEAYDESTPPKPGQLGRPVAMALGDGSRLLYVADTGKYPQIVAFALDGNAALNIAAGTRASGPINYGQTVRGEIGDKTFIDLYTFDGTSGDVVTITMEPGEGSQIDPYLEVLSPQGGRMAANDDAKDPTLRPKSSQIRSYRLPYTMTYTIRATRFGSETTTTTGSYTLSLTLERPGRRPSPRPTAGSGQ
jgi:hypothetical protein